MVIAHLSGKKKSVSSCSVISPCALSVVVPGSYTECPTSALLRGNTETATFSHQTPSAGLSLLTTRAYI